MIGEVVLQKEFWNSDGDIDNNVPHCSVPLLICSSITGVWQCWLVNILTDGGSQKARISQSTLPKLDPRGLLIWIRISINNSSAGPKKVRFRTLSR